jgi:hypothetical protein
MPDSEFKCYHSQEKWKNRLTQPIECISDTAWLGKGYYFWYYYEDAIIWGRDSKTRTGRYEIYASLIKNEDILDTVFNEKEYNFWFRQVEKAAKTITIKTGSKPTIKEINEYFHERGTWHELKGILFQDIPVNETILVKGLYYKKRIQLVLYYLDNVIKFEFHEEGVC